MGRGVSKAGGVTTGGGGALTKAQLAGESPLTQAQLDAIDGDKPIGDAIKESLAGAIEKYPGLITPIEEKDRKELCFDAADSSTGYYKATGTSINELFADERDALQGKGKISFFRERGNLDRVNRVRGKLLEEAKYNSVCVNMDYPKMKGTERQIDYAKNLIRGGIVRDVVAFNSRKSPRGQPRHALAETHKEQMKQAETKYNRNFDTYSDYVNHVITHGKGWTMDRIKGVENAGDIIDILNKYKKEKW